MKQKKIQKYILEDGTGTGLGFWWSSHLNKDEFNLVLVDDSGYISIPCSVEQWQSVKEKIDILIEAYCN